MAIKHFSQQFIRILNIPVRLLMVLFFVFSALNLQPPTVVQAAPTCVTSRISVSADDAEERNDSAAPGYVDIDGDTTNHYLQTYRAYGSPSGTALNYWGLRFLSVNVPQGATITSANVSFRALATNATESGMTFWGQLATNPTTFVASTSSTYNISSTTTRPRTTTTTAWTVPGWTSGTDYPSPDLSPIVQEIVNQSGWVANNAMVIVGQASVNQNKTAASRDSTNGTTLAPLLTVCYELTTPNITTTGTLSAFSSPVGTPSAEQSYTVAGANLTTDLVITPPTDFELSLTSGSGFSSSPINITPDSGTVASTNIFVRLNPTTAAAYSANITHDSTDAPQKTVAVSGSSVPNITITGTLTAFSAATGAYSAEKNYTVSAVNLTANLDVVAPADFEISTTSGSGFGPALSLTPTLGIVGSTTIYARFMRATAGASSGNITHDSLGVTQKTVAVSGTAADPAITVNSAMIAFYQAVGTPSPEQTYTIAGSYLKSDVTVTAPADFEISKTTGSGFASSLTFAPTSGTLTTSTIFVRMNRSTAGSSSGNITHTSTDAVTQNAAVTGTATNDTCVTSRISASTDDVEERADTGAVDVNGDGSTGRMSLQTYREYTTGTGVLNWWGLRFLNVNVPQGATISYSSITVKPNVTSGATAAGMTLWGQNLVNPPTFSTTASSVSTRAKTTATNAWSIPPWTSGVDYTYDSLATIVQELVNQPSWAANQAMVIIGQSTVTQNRAAVSWDTTTVGATQAPLLRICYSLTTPTITTTGALSAFSQALGSPSSEQNYSITGSNLGDDVTVTAPADFEISKTSGSGFASSLTFTPTSGVLASSPIYVRLNRSTAGTSSGNINHNSSGATQKIVAVTGSAGDPAITVTSTMTAFAQIIGTPSPEKTYTLSGSFLKGDITVTAPANFEISKTTGTGFGSSLTFSPTNGALATSTVYVRLNRSTLGASSGDISHASTDAVTQNVAVSGTATVAPPWTAYNDLSQTAVTNNTTFTVSGSTTGILKNFSNGVNTPVTVTITSSGSPTVQTQGAITAVGTDAHNTFTLAPVKANLVGVIQYGSSGYWVDMTFTGLDPAKTYTYATTANRDGSTYTTRISRFTLSGDDGAVNASTSGVTIINDHSVNFCTGYNTVNGYVARWMKIQPGSDGSFVVRVQEETAGNQGYGPSVFMLQEEVSTGPTISTTGTLTPFTTPVSVPSAPQTYTVEGSNLTDDIVLTAPSGFEISTDGIDYFSIRTLTQSGGIVAPATIYVRLHSLSIGTPSGNITHTSTDATTRNVAVSGTVTSGNHAPDAPTLVQPTDNATAVSTSPTLEVTVTDTDLNPMDISFYGRPTAATAEDFTIVVFPDTQKYANTTLPENYATFYAMTQWTADQQDTRNIVFATHVGDVVEDNLEAGWIVADTAFDTLDAAGVPYSIGFGNNDITGTDASLSETYFGVSRFTGKSWYGGHYGSNNRNNYSLFSASGMDFILINLDIDPSATVLDWADALLKANPTRRGIVESHNQLTTSDGWSNQAVFTALQDNPNMFLMLSGHLSSATDGVAKRTDVGVPDGQNIYSVLQDYQSYTNVNNGYLHIYRFSPADDKIYMTTYSPTLAAYNLATDSTLDFNYVMPDAPAYQLIGTVEDVANGGNASISWPGRANDTEYEWYATVSDAEATTTGSTWSFTTMGLPVNQAPVVTDIPDQTIAEGASFTTVNLDNYVSDVDNTDAEMTWTYSGNSALTVNISGRVATISTPSSDWNGAEAITFKATDPGDLFDDDGATFTVTGDNDAPVVSDIPNQTIAEGASFTTINLDNYVSDVDNTDAQMVWTNSGSLALTVSITDRVATIGIPNANWNGAETITFTATDPGTLFDDDTATFTVSAVNDAPVAVADTDATAEDTALVTTASDLKTNDTDVDNLNSELSVSAVSNPTNGVVALVSGNITFTPAANFAGTAGYDYTVSDGDLTDTGHVTISVTAVNDDPVAVDDTGTTAEDTDLVISANSLKTNDTDVDNTNGQLSVNAVSNPTNGTVALVSGDITFTPSMNFTGTAGFDYTVSDGTLTDTGHVTITVTAVNDEPVAVDDTDTTAEDTDLVIVASTLKTNDIDVDNLNSELSVTAVSNPTNGTVVLLTGDITFTPTANFAGSAGFDYTVSDGDLNDTGHVTITITAVNDTPVAVDDEFGTTEDIALILTESDLKTNDTDVDNNNAELSVTAVSSPTHGTVTLVSGTVTFTPAVSFVGTAGFDYTLSDGALTDDGHVTVAVTAAANHAPVITESDPKAVTMSEDGSPDGFNLTLHATDAEPDTHTWSIIGLASHGIAGASGTGDSKVIEYTPTANYYGSDSFEVQVSDGSLTDTITVNVTIETVNDAPEVTSIPNQTVDEGSSFTTIDLDNYVSDVDNTDAQMVWTNTGNIALTVSITDRVATISIPNANWNGVETITFKATDPGALYGEDAATFTVNAVNDDPVAVDDTGATAEDTDLVILASTLKTNDTDVDNLNSELSVSAVSNPTNGTVALASGDITFTPAANFAGTAGFDYTVSDGALTDTGHVTITVTAVNDDPVAVDDTGTTTEDTALVITASDLKINDTDVDNLNSELSVSTVSNPTNGTVALVSGSITFTPTANFAGTAGFDYIVSDGYLTDTGHVTITVTAVNDDPVAVDDTGTTAEDTDLVIVASTLKTNDTDVDNLNSELNVTAVSNPTNGIVALATGSITFTPAANFAGTAGFDYTVSDGALTDTGHVTITVTAVNDNPVAVDDTGTTAEDTALVISAPTLKTNDTDVDNSNSELSVTAVSNPTNGTAALVSGSITFTPTTNFAGTAGFDYTVTDGALTDSGHVTITVTAVNDAPVAVDDTGTTPVNTALVITASTLKTNDTDVDNTNAELSVTAISNPTNGTVALGSGNITFTPTTSFVGTAGYDYIVSDGAQTDTGHVTISVTAVQECTTVNLTATEDTYISAGNVQYNNGGSDSIHVDATTGTSRRTALMKWDLSSIPTNATVSSTSLKVNVTDASSLVFNLYNMRRSWIEGTSTQANSSTSANWNNYDGLNSWGTVGVASTSTDRFDTNLWGAGTSTFSSTGIKTVDLNTDGIAAVQGWVTTPANNFGLTMQNYTGSTANAVFFSSSEYTTAASRPILNVSYCTPPPGPTIVTTGSLSAFSSEPGVPSTAQTYTVSGTNLTADITITAPTGFEISTDGSNYFSSRTLAQTSGSVGSTTIYVRLNSPAEGTPSGNITHVSTGAPTQNKAVSGTVLNVYTLTVGNDGNGSATLNPAGGSYNNGTVVTLTPVPNAHYKFSDWSGTNALDIINTSGVYTIVMNGNKTVSANFSALPLYTLTPAVSPDATGSITLDPATGPYDEGTVVTVTAVPAAGYAFSSWTGNLSGSTNPTTITMDGDKFITAIFTAAPTCTTVNLVAAEDTYMSGYNPTYNYGGVNLLKSTVNSSGTSRGALLKWDIAGAAIPSDATVSSASMTLYVSTASSATYNLYNMRRSWVEGTLTTGAANTTSANWNTYDGSNTWGTGGAANTSSDRYNANMWGAGTTSFSSTGSKTVNLNTDGVSVVQGWINGSTTNYGVTIQNYSTTSGSDDLQVSSSENTTVANRPKLNITYCVGGATTHTLSISNDGHGTVTVNPDQATYAYGTVVTLTPVANSLYEFSTWSGADAEDPSDNGNGTWSLVMDSNKSITANFTLLPVNVAPNQPVLVQPVDNATSVSKPPTLEVTVSDSNPADILDVSFYGRAAGTTSAGDDFTMVVIPDTQNEFYFLSGSIYFPDSVDRGATEHKEHRVRDTRRRSG